jgi:hypothetical protein
MNDELKRIWKEVVMVWSGYYPVICLEGQRTTTENLVRIAGVLA